VSRESKILTAILVVVVGGMIALFAIANKPADSGPAPVGDKTKITRDSSHKEGSGPVQLVEFGDYQCPACGAAYPNVQQLMKDYDGKITFYFRNFPLTSLHPNAMVSAEAAEAAGAQGKYFEMHDLLYQNQKDWSEDADPTSKLVGYAKTLGLDTDKFQKDLSAEQYKSAIQQDMADGTALNINATPTFYLNGTMLTGGFDYASLKKAVDAALPAPSTAP
jgi:protein-disulfide isomerase